MFLDHPQIPLDNNSNEAIQRPAAIGRKLSFGSDSLEGATGLTAVMYTVFCTLAMPPASMCGAWLDRPSVCGRRLRVKTADRRPRI